MYFEPSKMESPDIYKILSGICIPRPIAFVSSLSPEGVDNVAPFSFFMPITPSPPHLAFSCGDRSGEIKDTLRNIQHTGDFVVNIVNTGIARRMAMSAIDLPREASEFEASGLTAVTSDLVKPKRVGESPASMECEVRQIVPVGGQPYGSHMIIGEILRFHVRDDLVLENNRIDLSAVEAVGRLAGDWYCSTDNQYDLPRAEYEDELKDWLD